MSELSAPEKLDVLGRAARLLAAATDFSSTLAHTIAACLPALGDFGFFDHVVEGTPIGGTVRRTARAHGDPEIEDILRPTQWVRQERTDLLSSRPLALGSQHVHDRRSTKVTRGWRCPPGPEPRASRR